MSEGSQAVSGPEGPDLYVAEEVRESVEERASSADEVTGRSPAESQQEQ